MRKTLLVIGICLMASVVFAAGGQLQPLKVKTGLWQVTSTTSASGLPAIPPDMQSRLEQMPPEQRAKMEAAIKGRFGGTPQTTTYKSCVTKKDLDTYPWGKGSDEKCTWTVVKSTGRDLEVIGRDCAAGREQGMKTEVHVKLHVLNSENVKASMEGTSVGDGKTVKISGTYTGKWIGAYCPAGTE